MGFGGWQWPSSRACGSVFAVANQLFLSAVNAARASVLSAAARPQDEAGVVEDAAGGIPDDQQPPEALSPAQAQLRRLRLPSPFERHSIAADEGPLIGRPLSPPLEDGPSSAVADLGPAHQPMTLADRIPSLAEWAGGGGGGQHPVILPTSRSTDRLPSLTPWAAAAGASGDIHAAMDAAAAAAAMSGASGALPPASGAIPVSEAVPFSTAAIPAALAGVAVRALHLSRPSSLAAISEQQPATPPATVPELLSRSSPLHPLNAPSQPLGPFRLGPALTPHSAAAASPTFATAAFPSLQLEPQEAARALEPPAGQPCDGAQDGPAPAHEEPTLRSQLFAALGVAMDALWFGRTRQDSHPDRRRQPQGQQADQEHPMNCEHENVQDESA